MTWNRIHCFTSRIQETDPETLFYKSDPGSIVYKTNPVSRSRSIVLQDASRIFIRSLVIQDSPDENDLDPKHWMDE